MYMFTLVRVGLVTIYSTINANSALEEQIPFRDFERFILQGRCSGWNSAWHLTQMIFYNFFRWLGDALS